MRQSKQRGQGQGIKLCSQSQRPASAPGTDSWQRLWLKQGRQSLPCFSSTSASQRLTDKWLKFRLKNALLVRESFMPTVQVCWVFQPMQSSHPATPDAADQKYQHKLERDTASALHSESSRSRLRSRPSSENLGNPRRPCIWWTRWIHALFQWTQVCVSLTVCMTCFWQSLQCFQLTLKFFQRAKLSEHVSIRRNESLQSTLQQEN